jgi:hypothetical protein
MDYEYLLQVCERLAGELNKFKSQRSLDHLSNEVVVMVSSSHPLAIAHVSSFYGSRVMSSDVVSSGAVYLLDPRPSFAGMGTPLVGNVVLARLGG